MKLVEILARELEEWPEGAHSVGMECDGDLHLNTVSGKFIRHLGQFFTKSEDWPSADVTREMWQAERERIARKVKVSAVPDMSPWEVNVVPKHKANKDGWIRHRGGKCPVDEGMTFDVRHRDGCVYEDCSLKFGEWEWSHCGDDIDIMAWRPHKPEQTNVIGFMGVEEIPAQTEKEGPIQWRDRIREIDAATIALSAERASLVAKLKAEGFVLVQGYEVDSGEESAQRDIAQQDMSDPANWRVGDQVEIVESSNPGWKQYKGMTGKLQNDGDWFIDFDSGDWYVSDNTEVKWHSRPTT